MENLSIEVLNQDARALPIRLQEIGEKIENEEGLQVVNTIKLAARKLRNNIKKVFEPLKKQAYGSYKNILDQWKEIEAPVIKVERSCDRLLSEYFAEQRRKREEAEKERLKEIQKRKEEEEKRLQEALKAEAEGDREKAEQIINKSAEEEKAVQSSVVIPEKPKLDKIHSRKDYDFEITDPEALPREYMMPNEALIRKVVKASKGKISIPGIRVIIKDIIVTKG